MPNFLKIWIYSLYFINISISNAQINRTKHWYFGDSIGLNFNTHPTSIDTNYKGWTVDNPCVISDSNGKLQYYANATDIYNHLHQKINTDFDLLGDWVGCQPTVLININSKPEFYFFSTAPYDKHFRSGLFYTFLKNSTFILKNKMLVKQIGEKQTSINHQNNKSIWHFSHSYLHDTFYGFLVQSKGILCCPIIQRASPYYDDWFPSQGIIKFSPNGKLCFNSNWISQVANIFQFNNQSGIFNKNIEIPSFLNYSGEFSANSNNLYIDEYRGNRLNSFNISSLHRDSILNSKRILFDTIGADYYIAHIQLNSLHHIMIPHNEMSKLGLITEPNNTKNCGLKLEAFDLKYRKSQFGLPNFNASYFYTPAVDYAYNENCHSLYYTFEGMDTLKGITHTWYFSKQGKTDQVNGKIIGYQFSDSGTWQVKYKVSGTLGTDSMIKAIYIAPKWQKDILGKDTFFCTKDGSISLTVPSNMHCIHWQGEEPDVERGHDYNHFHKHIYKVDTAGQYVVKLTNTTFCQIYDSIQIQKYISPNKPVLIRQYDTLKSHIAAHQYRWYYNGLPISTTNKNGFRITKKGQYQVELISKEGCSNKSDSFLVLQLGKTQIKNKIYQIWPNPNSGQFSIQYHQMGYYKIDISNAIGQEILSLSESNSQQTDIDIHTMNSGIYYVTVKNQNTGESWTEKVILE